jgi:hypothetical protein
MRVRPRPAALPGALLTLATLAIGCGGGGTEPLTPAAVSLNGTAFTLTTVGQTQQLSATVTDQTGATIASPSVTWTSSNGAVAGVSPTGLVTALGAGSAEITATAGAASARATITVAQTPTQLQKVSGDNQTTTLGQPEPQPLAVRVRDAGDAPVPGVTINFSAEVGAGNFGSASVVTGSDGTAATTFTPLRSGAIQVTAAVQGTGLNSSFTASAVSPFAIELQFLTTPTPAQAQAFTDAQQRWQTLLVGDLPDVLLNAAAGSCGADSPQLQRNVDDLLILVTIEPIDGPGAILGAAGPCLIRNVGSLTALGRMQFDSDDLADIEAAGLLEPIVTHEMGHVLGFGTLWPLAGLLADPISGGGNDPHFTGTRAIAEFDAAGGTSYVAGLKVPVEDGGGPGTEDAHWREAVFGSELMTGFVDAGFNPLSRISVAAMADLGYVVNQAGAQPYTLAAALRAVGGRPSLHLRNDVCRQPLGVVNASGQVMRTIQNTNDGTAR